MAFLSKDDIKEAYRASDKEATIWKEHYPAYERLADNGLMDELDENLPEVNDGSLAAALFKLPKRIVSSQLRGTVTVADRNEQWIAELAQLQWQNHIIPRANTQAPFHRKWKDAVRKAGIYGGIPLITLFVDQDGTRTTDFIVAPAMDVMLEAGKVSDTDSNVMFWDVYFSKQQLEDMLEQAKEESTGTKDGDNDETDSDDDSYNKWDVGALQDILDGKEVEDKDARHSTREENQAGVHKSGYHFVIVFQRGANAPFFMWHKLSNKVVREWSNPDPTGDTPVHYLYCYQDFNNPYGVGIVKLAGGTQNVLDYMRQADVLATQIGLRPPVAIEGQEEDVDLDSIVYAQDAIWFTGGAKVQRQELADGIYTELPNRISMYKTSLNQLIPTGDTSIGAQAGDPQYSKTPKGVQFQADNLSIDDEDFKDNLYITYNAVARSMINTHFANMEGQDLMKLDDDERQLLINAGLPFPQNGQGQMSNEVELVWDNLRAKFDFEVDPSSGIKTNDLQDAQNLQEALGQINPQTMWYMGQAGWKFDAGEAYRAMFMKFNLPNLERIITKMTDEEAQQAKQQPYPIIDMPQIRLTGQIPTEAMPAALGAGGVQVPQGAPMTEDQVDLGDILKDPDTTAEEKAQIKAMAGIQPTPVAPGQPTAAMTEAMASETRNHTGGMLPEELALRQRELDIKQQETDQRGAQLQLDKEKAAHGAAMDIIRESAPPKPATTPAPKGKK